MLGVLRRLVRLRGPMGVVAFAVGVGIGTGLVATHLVLAAWTYRDAARRDLREPGRWALAVLVGGVVSFSVYVAVQRASDWSGDSRAAGVVRRATGRGGDAGEPIPLEDAGDGDGDTTEDGADEEAASGHGSLPVEEASDDPSLAATAARVGWRATRRGASWAVGRARRRIAE